MISLERFIKDNTDKKIGVPWNPALNGQCVSLIQQYINQCLNQPMKARGNAKDWVTSYPKEGLGKVVNGSPQKGDILVWGKEEGGGYGHIAVYIGDNKIFDQNNGRHSGGKAGIGKTFGSYTVLRPYISLIEDEPSESTPTPQNVVYTVKKGDNLTKIAKKYNTTWRKLYENNKSVIGNDPDSIKIGQKLIIK